MTKKNESNDYTDMKTRTDILVHDLNGKPHTFYSKDICAISALEVGKRYLVEYINVVGKQEALIGEDQFNIIKYALGNKMDNLMTKETIKVKDNIITLQDIDNNKHVFPIKDIYTLAISPMDNNYSIQYVLWDKCDEEEPSLLALEYAEITKKQYNAIEDALDKKR